MSCKHWRNAEASTCAAHARKMRDWNEKYSDHKLDEKTSLLTVALWRHYLRRFDLTQSSMRSFNSGTATGSIYKRIRSNDVGFAWGECIKKGRAWLPGSRSFSVSAARLNGSFCVLSKWRKMIGRSIIFPEVGSRTGSFMRVCMSGSKIWKGEWRQKTLTKFINKL